MLVAGETSGDMLAADLVNALRRESAKTPLPPSFDNQPLHTSLEPRFFGAGGSRMAKAGVDLAFDMTAHSVIGLSDALKKILQFWQLYHQLLRLAEHRLPQVVICIDFSGFNRRFAHALRRRVRSRGHGWFQGWNPKIVQYVSPQVWASREGRAYAMARDFDLLLTIFPFENEWYAKRVPEFRVEFVGHPVSERYGALQRDLSPALRNPAKPLLLLLPGSRTGELQRHLPPMLGAFDLLKAKVAGLTAQLVLPAESLATQAKTFNIPSGIQLQVGSLPDALSIADAAIACTGTVTVECAWFMLPTVAIYKTSWSTYQIGKRIIRVSHLAMPNLLANETVFPELIQDAATAENIASAALPLLQDQQLRARLKERLFHVVAGLGRPGASERAARAILGLISEP